MSATHQRSFRDGSSMNALPDIYKHPRHWFQYFDTDGNGLLDRQECTIALAATFPFLTEDDLNSILATIWRKFDPDHTNYISVDQFIRRNGMCDMLQIMFPTPSTNSAQRFPVQSTAEPSGPSPLQRQSSNQYTPSPTITPPNINVNVPGNRQYFASSSASPYAQAPTPPVADSARTFSPTSSQPTSSRDSTSARNRENVQRSAPPEGPAPQLRGPSGGTVNNGSATSPALNGPVVSVSMNNSPRYDGPQSNSRITTSSRSTRAFGDPNATASANSYVNAVPTPATNTRSFGNPQNSSSGRVVYAAQSQPTQQKPPPQYQSAVQQYQNIPPEAMRSGVAVGSVRHAIDNFEIQKQQSSRTINAPPPSYNEVKRNQMLSSNSDDLYTNKQFLRVNSSYDSEISAPMSSTSFRQQKPPDYNAVVSRSQKAEPKREECPVNIFDNPRLWFQYFDTDHNGHLDKQECMRALRVTFQDMDVDTIAGLTEGLWDDFVNPQTRLLFVDDFVKPNGLCDMILASLPSIRSSGQQVSGRSADTGKSASTQPSNRPNRRCPHDIRRNPDKWFEFFDSDKNGYLDQSECENAFRDTFPDMDPELISTIIENMWFEFINDETGLLSISEFSRPNGLSALILQQLSDANEDVSSPTPSEATRSPSKRELGSSSNDQMRTASTSGPPLLGRSTSASASRSKSDDQNDVAIGKCPYSIYDNPKKWFQFYDKDNSGNLDKEECVHALSATFTGLEPAIVEGLIEDMWDEFVNPKTRLLAIDDFIRKDGLCETILHQLQPEDRGEASPSKPKKSKKKSKGARKCPFSIYDSPRQWFQYYDKDKSGNLDMDECVQALSATFSNLDPQTVEGLVEDMWDEFVNPKTHLLGIDDFVRKGGLCETILSQLPQPSNSKQKSGSGNRCPFSIYDSPRQWFQYYDKDKSGNLDMEECAHALSATFSEMDPQAVEGLVEDMWDEFVNPKTRLLGIDDFVRKGGLCETILNQLPKPKHSSGSTNSCPFSIYDSPRQWFQFYDKDRSGNLDMEECAHALAATFSEMDPQAVEGLVEDMWDEFVNPKTRLLGIDDFVRKGGLCETILGQLPRPKGGNAGRAGQPRAAERYAGIQAATVPDIFTSPRQWFMYFDKDKSGTLDKEEVEKAFETTFPDSDAGLIDGMIEDMWDGFVNPKTKLLSIDEFVRDEGLCDTILEQLGKKPAHSKSPRKNRQKPPPQSSNAKFLNLVGLGSKATGKRKALFIGINYYGTDGMLQSSIHDCQIMKTLLTDTYGWELKSDTNLKILRDNTTNMQVRPNKKNIIDAVKWLVDGARKGDVLFLHYSGHTAQIQDKTLDKVLECIVPVDFKTSGFISDPELSKLLVQPLKEGVRLTIIMDTVRSSCGLELPCEWTSSVKNKSGGWITGGDCFYSPADIVLISGCTNDLKCDNRLYSATVGAVTSAFCRILTTRSNPDFQFFMKNMALEIRKLRTDIRPQLSSSQAFDIDDNTLFSIDAMARSNTNKKLGPSREEGIQPPGPRPLPRDPLRDMMLGKDGLHDGLEEEIDLEITA